jgi:hypothetical protein
VRLRCPNGKQLRWGFALGGAPCIGSRKKWASVSIATL